MKRSSGTGTATVHWSTRDVGSAQRGVDYPQQNGSFAIAGDLSFAAGETSKAVTSIWTLDEAAPEPDETLHSTSATRPTSGFARATATATILNDDTQLDSSRRTCWAMTARPPSAAGRGLTSRSTALLRHGGRPESHR